MTIEDIINEIKSELSRIRTLQEMDGILNRVDDEVSKYKLRDQIELLAFRADCYVQQELFDRTVPDYERIIKIGLEMNDEEGLINAGAVGINLGLLVVREEPIRAVKYLDQSIEILQRVKTSYPDKLVQAMLHRAAIREHKLNVTIDKGIRDYEEALGIVRKYKLEIPEDEIKAVVGNLQRIYGVKNEPIKAEALLTDFSEPWSIFNVANAYGIANDFEGYIRMGEKFLARVSNNPRYSVEIAMIKEGINYIQKRDINFS